MKKLRKLFNLLPAFALAVISGLGVVLDNDQTPKEVNADTIYYSLYSEEFSSSISTSFTQSDTFPIGTFTTSFTINGTFTYYYAYKETGKEYSFNCNLQFRNCYSSYYGNFTLERLYIPRTIVSTNANTFRIDLIRFEGQSPYQGKIPVKFYFDIYVDGTKIGETQAISNATITNQSLINGGVLKGTANQTIMNVTYTPTDYDTGYGVGYGEGYNAGFNDGYSNGNSFGYNNGYSVGYQDGVDSQAQAISDAYNEGYSAGYDEGYSVDGTAATIFSGILQVGMLPINVLLAIFNFEILGINLSAFISAILTVCLTVIVIRTVTGGKNSE